MAKLSEKGIRVGVIPCVEDISKALSCQGVNKDFGENAEFAPEPGIDLLTYYSIKISVSE